MKNLNLKKLLLTLALIFFLQNGTIVVPDMTENTYSGEELVSPCNDAPSKDACVD